MRRLHWRGWALAALTATALLMLGWPALSAEAADGPSISAGRPAAASSSDGAYTAANATDGDQSTYTDTVLKDITVTGAKKSGDAFDAKSGFGLWANEMPEDGQGPAIGEVTVHNLKTSDNGVDVRNTTSTFRINRLP